MRRLLLLSLVLAGSVSGLLSSPAPVKADGCTRYCATNACGYTCCYRECCGRICVDLDCAPPPPCEIEN
ncbi:MAG TPA: hypothetical protein VIW92_07375 [Thermoanaerobaculia bacterium]